MSDKGDIKVLIVDGDSCITDLLADALGNEGYAVEVLGSAIEALTLPLEQYRLIISETATGEIDGFEFLERLKDAPATAVIPFIFCSADDGENNIINGLNQGADDYVVKPFSLREMMARVRSVLRRHRFTPPAPVAQEIEFKTLKINLQTRSVSISGSEIPFSPTEFQILSLLMRNRNKLFNRDEIFKTAWPGEAEVSKRTVDVNISRIRKKLQDYGSFIVNRSGVGYGFVD